MDESLAETKFGGKMSATCGPLTWWAAGCRLKCNSIRYQQVPWPGVWPLAPPTTGSQPIRCDCVSGTLWKKQMPRVIRPAGGKETSATQFSRYRRHRNSWNKTTQKKKHFSNLNFCPTITQNLESWSWPILDKFRKVLFSRVFGAKRNVSNIAKKWDAALPHFIHHALIGNVLLLEMIL